MESGPTSTENAALRVCPPVEVSGTVKVAGPCCAGVRVSMGFTVKVQLLPVWVTPVSLVLSTLVASPQVMV